MNSDSPGDGNGPMTSNRPYLLRSLYDWILDNGKTPCVLVDARDPGVNVPTQYIEDGRIILNISPAAIRDLTISEEGVNFHGRFGGMSYQVHFPVACVLAIYARENGEGMVLPESALRGDPPTEERPVRQTPSLRLVK